MKVNIYYGGRGLLDDPTLYVIDKMQEVLAELRVTVERYNIYEHKNTSFSLCEGILCKRTLLSHDHYRQLI